MKIIIEIDAGENTCDGCELFPSYFDKAFECHKFGKLNMMSRLYPEFKRVAPKLSYNTLRHKECLEAEQQAKEKDQK